MSTPRTTISARIAAALSAVALAGTLAACSPSSTNNDRGSGSSTTAGSTDPSQSFGKHVDADTFLQVAASEGVTIIDVRTPHEFATGHLPEAVNIDVNSSDFAKAISELDPAGTYAIYCRSGNRSAVAQSAMAEAGITSTVGLNGGVGALSADLLVTE